MNLGEASIVLRRRQGTELVDLALRFVRSLAPRSVLWLVFTAAVPAWGLCAYLHYADFHWAQIWLIAFLLCKLVELPFIVLMGDLLFNRESSAKEAWKGALNSLGRYLGGQFFYLFFLALGSMVLVGSIFVAGRLFYLPEVLVLERAKPTAGLKRASRFLAGRENRGLSAMLNHFVFRAAFVLFLEILGHTTMEFVFAFETPMDDLFTHGGSVFSLLGLFLFAPYSAAYRFLAYTNERTIQDGWDVQVAFLRIANQLNIASGERRAA